MPANWSNPTTTSNYSTGVLQVIDERLDDAVSLFNTDGTNIPENALKYNRAGNKFQERITGAWVDKVLSVAGGGTGGATSADARTNLGLGTLSTQNANNVAITGGSISGLTSLDVAGNVTISGTVSGDGSLLTNLNATNLASGTVATARLGSGVASAASFLRGDSAWTAVPSGVPAGLIALFDVACPTGWTRFSPLDGYFPLGQPTYGATGGSSIHSHTTSDPGSHTHGISGNTASADITHSHAFTTGTPSTSTFEFPNGSGSSAASTNHTHSGTTDNANSAHVHGAGSLATAGSGGHTHTTDTATHTPFYLGMVFCKKDA